MLTLDSGHDLVLWLIIVIKCFTMRKIPLEHQTAYRSDKRYSLQLGWVLWFETREERCRTAGRVAEDAGTSRTGEGPEGVGEDKGRWKESLLSTCSVLGRIRNVDSVSYLRTTLL